MKIFCVVSTLDIQLGYGCTPAWWQLLKGLAEEGHEVIAVPYLGPSFETPWWRTYANPCQVEGNTFAKVKHWFGSGATSTAEGLGSKLTRTAIDNWVRPRWEAHLGKALETERNTDALIFVGVPVNHFSGVPTRMRGRFRIPVVFYDGDVPVSLPRFRGFSSGFRIYEDADLTEYDALISNSTGGAKDLEEMGAKQVFPLHWGVDPDLYLPGDAEPTRDVFFYGIGAEYREDWIRAMVVEPSRRIPDAQFVLGGRNFALDIGKAQEIGDVPFSRYRHACALSRINLNITREAHATVFASASSRPFELAAMGCCIVSNPVEGIETWFEPGRELIIVHNVEEAVDTYQRLLADETERKALGEAARQRLLAEHTHRHRARELVDFLKRL